MSEKTITIPVEDFEEIEKVWFGLDALVELLDPSDKLSAAADLLWPFAQQLGQVVTRHEDELRELRHERQEGKLAKLRKDDEV